MLFTFAPSYTAAMPKIRSHEIVSLGPYAGEIAEVDHILPGAKYPQFAQDFWNLELMPQTLNRRKGDKGGQRQIDLLKRLER